MRTIFTCFSVVTLSLYATFGESSRSVKTAIEAGSISAVVANRVILSRPDIALAKSILDTNRNGLKGAVSEAVHDQFLNETGEWKSVSARIGSQGFDHVLVQLNQNGNIRRFMVDETKFGSSKLGKTDSGIQMGSHWTANHLRALATRYDRISEDAKTGISFAETPKHLSRVQVLNIPLNDSQSATFWRYNSKDDLHYDGPPELIGRASRQANALSRLVRAGANGEIDFRRRIFQVKLEDGIWKISILNAEKVDATNGNFARLPLIDDLKFPFPRFSEVTKTQVIKALQRVKPNWSRADINSSAEGILNIRQDVDVLAPAALKPMIGRKIFNPGLTGVLIIVPIEIAGQIMDGMPVDWSKVVGVGGLAVTSSIIGENFGGATAYAIMDSEIGYSASARVAEICGLGSANRLAGSLGGIAGGGAASLVFAYGGYFLKYYDIETANRNALIGVGVTGVGVLAYSGTLALISTFGTASTGVAISSLSGVAATNASLAWVGGGSLAAGGSGMAAGAVVLSAGAGVVVFGAFLLTMHEFHVYDEHEDDIRLRAMINYLSNKQTFSMPASENFPSPPF